MNLPQSERCINGSYNCRGISDYYGHWCDRCIATKCNTCIKCSCQLTTEDGNRLCCKCIAIKKDNAVCHFCNIDLVDIDGKKVCHGCKRVDGILKIRSYDDMKETSSVRLCNECKCILKNSEDYLCSNCDIGIFSAYKDNEGHVLELIEDIPKECMTKSHQIIKVDDIDYKELIEKCLNTLESKGKDYTLGSEDKLHNFRTVAEFTGLTKEKILSVYLYKQIAAVFSYCKTNCQSESEPIEARIMDSVNYLLLLYKMVKENKSIKEKTNK